MSAHSSWHFIQRVTERIGPHVSATALARGIVGSVRAADGAVEFVARVDRDGCRLFRFRVPDDGRYFYALVDTEKWVCVTVMPPGFVAGRVGKSRLKLKDVDL